MSDPRASRGASLIELSAATFLLLLFTAGAVEFGRVFLQSISLSMVALESTLLAGTLNLNPGSTVSPAVAARKDSLLTLPGQSRAFTPGSVNLSMEFSRIGTSTLPPNTVRVRLSTTTAAPLGLGAFAPSGIPLEAAYVGPNFMGAPLTINPGFQNPSPLVDCDGASINGCSTAACAIQSMCP